MTDKELKRLRKIELLEILIAQDEEIEDLNNQLRDLREQLDRSNAIIDRVLNRIPKARAMMNRAAEEEPVPADTEDQMLIELPPLEE